MEFFMCIVNIILIWKKSYIVVIMETMNDVNNPRRNFELLRYDEFDCSIGLRFIIWLYCCLEERGSGIKYVIQEISVSSFKKVYLVVESGSLHRYMPVHMRIICGPPILY